MTKRVSEATERRIVYLSRQGLTKEEVAGRIGICTETVSRYRRKNGLVVGRNAEPVRSPARQRRLDLNRLAARRRMEFREMGVAALVGPPIPPWSCRYRAPRAPYRCRHELLDGECATCEREERRFVTVAVREDGRRGEDE